MLDGEDVVADNVADVVREDDCVDDMLPVGLEVEGVPVTVPWDGPEVPPRCVYDRGEAYNRQGEVVGEDVPTEVEQSDEREYLEELADDRGDVGEGPGSTPDEGDEVVTVSAPRETDGRVDIQGEDDHERVDDEAECTHDAGEDVDPIGDAIWSGDDKTLIETSKIPEEDAIDQEEY